MRQFFQSNICTNTVQYRVQFTVRPAGLINLNKYKICRRNMYASRVDLTWAGWTQFGERRGQHGLSRTTATAAEASCPWCEATTSLLISSPLSSAHQQPPHRNNVFIRYQPLSSAHYQPLRITANHLASQVLSLLQRYVVLLR